MKNTLIFIIAILLAAGSGFALQKYLQPGTAQATINAAIGNIRPEFAAADLNGNLRNIKEWDGKLIFLNFWATWCPPCKKEIPAFVELQEAYGEQGFQIIGIAIDDQENVAEYAEQMKMNYPSLIVNADGVGLAQRYGNGVGVLPYTVIIDRSGEISNTITGELSKIRAKELLEERGIQL